MTPMWWSPQDAALVGAIGGSLIGVLGGLVGVLLGVFARHGKFKVLNVGMLAAGLGLGVLLLAAAVVALVARQPYHVWYPLVLGGLVLTIVGGTLLPLSLWIYRMAEHRRMEAQAILRT